LLFPAIRPAGHAAARGPLLAVRAPADDAYPPDRCPPDRCPPVPGRPLGPRAAPPEGADPGRLRTGAVGPGRAFRVPSPLDVVSFLGARGVRSGWRDSRTRCCPIWINVVVVQ